MCANDGLRYDLRVTCNCLTSWRKEDQLQT